jgi:hypothetical protein
MQSDSDFESSGERNGAPGPAPASASASASECQVPQVFYFSKKLFDFMCAGATEEYIQRIGQEKAAERKGILKKREEGLVRTDKIRALVEEKGAKKPSNSELLSLYRQRNVRKAATARQTAYMNRKKQCRETGDLSGREGREDGDPVEAQSQTNSQSQSVQSKKRILWQTVPIPQSVVGKEAVIDHAEADSQTSSMQHSIRHACNKLCNDFTQDLDDCVAIDASFKVPRTNYDIHGQILSRVITRCTMHKTGQVFVRWKVDHINKFFTLLCKLSNKLTGRQTERKVFCPICLACCSIHILCAERQDQ